MTDRRDKAELVEVPPAELEREVEPPVVARLIVEIRSDGSRTIARGAVEDTASGHRTTIEARGDSPLQLALALARSLTQMPRALFSRPASSSSPSSPGARPGLRGLRGLLGRRRRG
ncbi:MAG TPA: hypothetical protein VK932_04300 [Kofleriaceae bacterium]|nr:hypothetical protein [Kofleriaceae bacterium]